MPDSQVKASIQRCARRNKIMGFRVRTAAKPFKKPWQLMKYSIDGGPYGQVIYIDKVFYFVIECIRYL